VDAVWRLNRLRALYGLLEDAREDDRCGDTSARAAVRRLRLELRLAVHDDVRRTGDGYSLLARYKKFTGTALFVPGRHLEGLDPLTRLLALAVRRALCRLRAADTIRIMSGLDADQLRLALAEQWWRSRNFADDPFLAGIARETLRGGIALYRARTGRKR
jgi:hypothetical protein